MYFVTKPARRLKTSHALLAVGLLAGLNSNAAAMRCGTELVDEGDSQHEVALKCGKPTSLEQNRWIYNLGPYTFIKIVHFRGGQVHSIDTGQYGSSGREPAAQYTSQ
jgi:Protein of unknown function (DUF2845)